MKTNIIKNRITTSYTLIIDVDNPTDKITTKLNNLPDKFEIIDIELINPDGEVIIESFRWFDDNKPSTSTDDLIITIFDNRKFGPGIVKVYIDHVEMINE